MINSLFLLRVRNMLSELHKKQSLKPRLCLPLNSTGIEIIDFLVKNQYVCLLRCL